MFDVASIDSGAVARQDIVHPRINPLPIVCPGGYTTYWAPGRCKRREASAYPMICPYCTKDNDKVIDSRSSEAGRVIRRRRQCLECHKRFTTYERVEETVRLTVIKKDGSRVPFSRDNILKGVLAACGKRPIPEERKVRLVDEVEDELHRTFDREVESRVIGEMVAGKLRDLDEIAYVRFASEYYQFKNVGDILKTFEELSARVKDVKEQQRLFGEPAAKDGPAG